MLTSTTTTNDASRRPRKRKAATTTRTKRRKKRGKRRRPSTSTVKRTIGINKPKTPSDRVRNVISAFNKKKRSKIPITDNISIIIIFDIFFENKIMLEHHSDKTNTHSKIEPSWAPQTAENL